MQFFEAVLEDLEGEDGSTRFAFLYILHLALLLSAIGDKERDQMMPVPSFEFGTKEG